ncbi:MAG: hypothetical protein HDS75_03465 [Bacteroidales bacterium]|nr:hypothetical protein [Bacteroidales bacterium]
MGKISTRLSASVFASLLLATTASAGVKFNAVVSWPDHQAGVYSYDTDSYDPQLIKKGINANGGGYIYKDGYYYATQYVSVAGITGVNHTAYDMKTWEVENGPYTADVTNIATATASYRDLGLYVGCYYNADGETFRFCTIKGFYQTKIADLEKPWSACAFDKNGTLYAIESEGALYTVDPSNGQMTLVGQTGLTSTWNTGAIVDPETNAFIYATKTDDKATLYSINLETAAATKIYDLDNAEQLCGFYLDSEKYADGAPGASTSAPSMSIYDTNLTQNLTYYLPRYTVSGDMLTGQQVTYHVYANGKEIASGTETVSAYTSSKRISVTVDEPGTYCFSVDFTNEAGTGPRTYSDTYFLGPDSPKAPSSCQAKNYTDGKVTVSWGAASSSGLHGGRVDYTNATYILTRYPDGVVVTPEGHKTTSFVDSIGFPDVRTNYYYTAKILIGDVESPTTQSAKFALGPITPPGDLEFNSSVDFFGFTTLNAGTDTKKWEFDSDKVLRVATNSRPADNYLVLPELNLKAGETYPVVIEAAAYSTSYTSETMEVVAGPAPTVEALTQIVIENTSVLGGNYNQEYLTYEGTLTAPAEGTCYLAIHATTPENGGYLYIKSIKISKGMGERAPGAATEFTATAAADGTHTVELSFKLPAADLSGDALDALTSAVILRDTDTIATLTTGLTPGEVITYTDKAESLTGGKHVYTVVCANEHGEGTEAKAETFVGFAAPVAVASVSMTEPTEGHVIATWEPVTADVEGRTLSADNVTYNVYKYLAGEKYPVAQNVKGTTYEYDPFEDFEHDGSQRFVQTLIEAVTEGGSSKIVPSLNTPVGKSYTAPWAESFADCKTKSIFANLTVSGTDVWRPAAEDDFGTKPADNDGGMIAFEGYGRAACTLMSGKIDLADVLEPAVSMQVYNFGSGATNENILEVSVRATGDAQFTKIFSTKISEVGPKQEWSKVIVPLSDYAGQTVQIAFTAYNNEYSWTHIDDIKVTSNASHNLSVNTFKAPVSVEPGAEFTLSAEIENVGLEDAKGFKVNLLCDEDIVDTKTIALLATNNKTSVTFNHSFSIFETGTHAFAVELDYALDMLDTDNSAELEVVVRTNTLPTVTDLAAEPADNGAKLTWSAPTGAKAKVATTENFDAAYIGWKSEIEGWTFLDLDRGFIGGIGSKQLPVSGRQSFFVFNNTLSALQNGNIAAFAAHSGNQFLCSMYSTIGDNMVQSDDWAITPELSGEPQVISLYASSFQSDPGETQYLETFQLLYSTTDTDPESFTLIEEYVKIPATWREYKAYVPEGTKYFAIRCVSYNQYMLFIDDVKYVAKNAATESVTPAAYNIYRDGLKLNDEPVAANTFIDETIDHKSTYKYHVSALYDATESLPSNEVVYDSTKSGVDAVGYDTVTISTSAGVITVAGAEGADITVVAADGKVIAAEKGLAVNRFNVQPGIYIVKAADTVVKLSVR